jgi:hypothetical protein
MSEVQDGAGFTAPSTISSGAAEMPKNGGVVTKKSATKEAVKSTKGAGRNIKVMAIAKGWFDCKRIDPGMKLTVSESEYSEKWMQKI